MHVRVAGKPACKGTWQRVWCSPSSLLGEPRILRVQLRRGVRSEASVELAFRHVPALVHTRTQTHANKVSVMRGPRCSAATAPQHTHVA